ncbi:hypothetical protein JWG39_07055 [Desulforhopalus vacuolatus]|uniref:hypothetical protein n=1 Tax=Desulforhopalus vacuolatus TaxID=40414 RepID=UPI001965F724|nr:hypothetical protein [Desulforhopalus vacuolatus]MBM9519577.1 hypothetical protein [Desulforhopalus vacuolatus]
MKNKIVKLLFILFLTAPGTALAVNASFQSASSTRSTLVVNLSQPTGTLIVEQYLSPDTRVTGTTPPAHKINRRSVTWLLKKSGPGRRTFTVQFAAPPRSLPSATIKYQDRASGQFIEQRVNP